MKTFFFAVAACLSLLSFHVTYAQCPPNIDFEAGNFTGWNTYSGVVSAVNNANYIDLSVSGYVDPDRHVMYTASQGDGLDPWGQFPKNCPNGSGHSIRLGDEFGGFEAAGASYEFDIPAGMNQFTLTYYYAIILAVGGHLPEEQARLEVSVTANNSLISCSSFSYVASGSLPGFFPSPLSSSVQCRNWSGNAIDLNNMAGMHINLFFKTADCTLGGHFGYAYLDVDTPCDGSFPGASYCPGDTSVDVYGPLGYDQYNWHYPGSSVSVGTGQMLHLVPAPPSGTVLNVDVTPFPGYGCPNTYSVTLTADLIVTADAGPDKTICDNKPVQIGVPPKPGVVYAWSPAAGLSNPNVSNPLVMPTGHTTYTLTAHSSGAGCTEQDQVTIFRPALDSTITVSGSSAYCEGSGVTILQTGAADSIQWYKNGIAIPAANQSNYSVLTGGDYKAELFSFAGTGCKAVSKTKKINIFPMPHALFGVNAILQCSPKDKFIIQNNSAISSGPVAYTWNFGDGTSSALFAPAHHYGIPGTYNIKLTATAGTCTDDTTIQVTVKAGADPLFTARDVCIGLPLMINNFTNAPGATSVNYLWDFGDGNGSALAIPSHTYSAPGRYTIRLNVSTAECPLPPAFKDTVITVDVPAPAVRYPTEEAVINYPLPLQARNIGSSVIWTPAFQLDNSRSYRPVFKGAEPKIYTIKLTTKSGCETVDTLLVKTIKKIAIYVPGAFTPNRDGKNDLLRPLLYGFKKLNFFRVFDRWGKLLFETSDDQKGWDGMVNGIRQDMQSVVWIISAEDVDGKHHEQSGMTVILR